MGDAENQLKAMAGAQNDWAIPALPKLHTSLGVLIDTMSNVMASTEWDGATASAANAAFNEMRARFARLEAGTAEVQRIIDQANSARHRAVDAIDGLPSSEIDPTIVAAARTASAIVFRGITLPADTAISWIEGLLGNEREEAAKRSVKVLDAELADRRRQLSAATNTIYPPDGQGPESETPDSPTRVPQQPGGGGLPSRGAGTPFGSGIPDQMVSPSPIGGGSNGSGSSGASGTGMGTSGSDARGPSVDGGTGGSFPGGGSGGAGGGGFTPGGTGGGLIPGLLGGGAGAAALGVGSKLATSGFAGVGGGGVAPGGMGAGGTGGLGAGAGAAGRIGSGGLLGSQGVATGGTSGTSGPGAGSAAAGGRGGTGMMGGGMGGGAASEKEKRSGLGGLMAPKLEDEQDAAPRSAGAGAGGRTESTE